MAQHSEDPEDIAGWQRLDAGTTTSGRLKAQDVERLAGLGVRHVINLALSDSPGALADEDALIAQHGLRYTHIPIPFEAPEEAHYQAFCRALEDDGGPVHVHCIMNWRVSAFFYRYNIEQGMDKAQARALMERQWSPETNTDPRAAAWASFIAQGEN
jgi:protein tyrosine phosphatase (PTP) superfamily phosphohydrolase (DUF442 family)